MFEWSDLRHFLAVARHGSTLAAARALGVNQSTVHRRLAEFERRVGHPLVSRHPSGYRLTEAGQSLLPYAQSVENAAIALERMIDGLDTGLDGTIRLTCPEPIVARLTASPLLEKFHERHPGLRIEFAMSDRYLDLSRGEADVALRSGDPEDPDLVGRKIADSVWAVYASQSYVQHRGRPQSAADLGRHLLVGFDGSMANHRAAKWLAAIAPQATIASRSNSVLGVLLAVKSGIGVAPLPTTIADAEQDLVKVLPPVPELARGWYLLAHPELRHTPRISAFFDFIVEELPAVRSILMG
ncbi:MAG: LysR family transcriptional regulator [Devosia sp.]